jgi:sarcosine oxidase gamma subunit
VQTRAADLASVTDQSGSHADAFGPGSAATSVIAHIGVIVWQVDDAPTYDLAVFRSLHAGLRHWIEITAASNRAFDDRIVLSAARHRRARLG